MKVSILLAVYNGEKYIRKSLQSLLDQTYPDFEILIGFNGTTDRSKEIVKEFNDPRIRIYDFQDEKGKARTLNKLIGHAKGKWIAIQDDDDIWMPDKLAKQLKLEDHFDVIGSQISYINEADQIIGNVDLALQDKEIKMKSLSGDNQVANTSAIVRKDCLMRVKGWREDVDGIEDYDLWLRIMRKGYKFINLDSVTVLHRLHVKSNFNTRTFDLSKILNKEDIEVYKNRSRWKKFFNFFSRK